MTWAVLLAIILTILPASAVKADDARTARHVAQKDYKAALRKIRANDADATEQCRHGPRPASEACLIQARGKRMRAEQEAKTKLDRSGQAPPLPDAQASQASREAADTAKKGNRSIARDIDTESKSADAECNRLTGAARETCTTEVAQRRTEARSEADAMYRKARSDAKAIKAP